VGLWQNEKAPEEDGAAIEPDTKGQGDWVDSHEDEIVAMAHLDQLRLAQVNKGFN
jgi:hypothetical protein